VERQIVSTPAELAQIQWLYRVDTSRVVVIPPGVDSSRFYPIQADEAKEYIGIREERRIILFVGRIEPLKGIDTLLEAVRLLRTNPEADFADQLRVLVIGGDPGADPETMSGEMRRLLDLCRELEVEDLVRFLGQRDQDILPYYYSAADVVVVPSHYESFGLVALEAMACGTPVVASETGGLVYLVRDGETGFHIPAAQPQALADRLQQLLEDEALRSKLGAQASAYARGYAWSEMVNKILDVYSELLGRAA
jgi:D-inositol-3-phosphate glycosyltransferase